MDKKSVKTPKWSRVLLVICGVVAISASMFALTLAGLAFRILVLLLSLALLFVGLSRLARGISLSPLNRGHRVLDISGGLLGIAIGMIAFLFPLIGLGTLVFMLALGVMIYGIVGVVIGASANRLTNGVRVFVLLAGILTVIFSAIVMVGPAAVLLTLLFLLSLPSIINGIESIVLAFE